MLWEYQSRLKKQNRKGSAVFKQLQPVWSTNIFTIKKSYVSLRPSLCPPQSMQAIHGEAKLKASNNWTSFNNVASETL